MIYYTALQVIYSKVTTIILNNVDSTLYEIFTFLVNENVVCLIYFSPELEKKHYFGIVPLCSNGVQRTSIKIYCFQVL